jgi:hypothetical protein
MRRAPALAVAVSLALLSVTSLAAQDKAAPKPPPAAPGAGPVRVKMGMNVTSLGKFDIATGSFSAEFTISFATIGGPYDATNGFDISGGKVTSFEKVADENGKAVYKVKADINDDVDLSEYPFDGHALDIVVGDKEKNDTEVVFEADTDNLGLENTVKIPGWRVRGFSTKVTTERDPTSDESYSYFHYDVNIERIPGASFMKSMLPVCFMVLVATLSIFLKAKSGAPRLAMGSAALLSAVMFHVSSTSSLPPLGYLTRQDKFMLATYVVLVVNIMFSVMVIHYDDQKDDKIVNWAINTSKMVLPLLAVVAYAIVLLRLV